MTVIFIFILILFFLLCCIVSFLAGFLAARIKDIKSTQRKLPALTEAEEGRLKKAEKEYSNFMSYDGDNQ